METSPYFVIADSIEIKKFSDLLDLNKPKTFSLPGVLAESLASDKKISPEPADPNIFIYSTSHNTSGLFRGQEKNWPLIPSAYRKLNETIDKDGSEIIIKFRYDVLNGQLNKFSQIASQQNPDFPNSKIDQMIIAQHYGIATPLLDWTTNIFVAVYFALDIKSSENKDDNPLIYHITDERLLGTESEIIQKNIELFDKSCFVKPLPIDRRIERQFSAFTFHPLPFDSVYKVPLIEYKLSWDILNELWQFMEGIGFSSYHYFPDYAGIAEKIRHSYLL